MDHVDSTAMLNLLLSIITVLFLPIGGFLIKKWIDGIQEAAQIRTEGLRDDIDELKTCVQSIKVKMSSKVDKEECKEKCDEKWERLNHHSHDDEGRVIVL